MTPKWPEVISLSFRILVIRPFAKSSQLTTRFGVFTIRPRFISEAERFPISTLRVMSPQEMNIMAKRVLYPLIALGLILLVSLRGLNGQQSSGEAISIGSDDIGGVVTSSNGPEAGVWVIAETTDLPTKFVKIVVTDDKGRYLLPQLPKANYKVWVRGYGLVDSPKVRTAPGKILNLTAVPAPSAAAAAEYYPAIYWYSMLKVPEKSEFPGTGASGNGINPNMKGQGEYLDMVRTDGCVGCHQLGNKATRTISPELGHFNTGYEGWIRRIQSGQARANMV